jgi:hypothetical protein
VIKLYLAVFLISITLFGEAIRARTRHFRGAQPTHRAHPRRAIAFAKRMISNGTSGRPLKIYRTRRTTVDPFRLRTVPQEKQCQHYVKLRSRSAFRLACRRPTSLPCSITAGPYGDRDADLRFTESVEASASVRSREIAFERPNIGRFDRRESPFRMRIEHGDRIADGTAVELRMLTPCHTFAHLPCFAARQAAPRLAADAVHNTTLPGERAIARCIMIISVVNFSKVSDADVQSTIRAINQQISQDFEPYWFMGARLRLEGRASDKPMPQSPEELRGDAIIYLWDQTDVPNALGYHEANNRGIPYGFIFMELAAKLGEAWSVTLSHEALELIGDAYTNQFAAGPHPDPKQKGRIVFHWYEMCDAVQADTYQIDSIAVSDFVLPPYFAGGSQPGARNDFLGSGQLAPFGISPGGYVGFYDPMKQSSETWTPDAKAQKRLDIKVAAGISRRAIRYEKLAKATIPRAESTKLVPDVVYRPTRSAAPRMAVAGPSPLNGLKSVVVRVSQIRVLDNHASGFFGGDAAADVYPIVLVTSDNGAQPAQLGSPGIFNGIFDGDRLPISAPGFTVSRSLNAVPSFLDIHILVMRSKERQRDIAKAIADALTSQEGKSATAALTALVTGANPIAGTALSIGTSILQIVTNILAQGKDEQIFYGITSLERDPDSLGIGVTHSFTDDRNALALVQVVGEYS